MSQFTASLGLRLVEGQDGHALLKGGRCQWDVIDDVPYEVGAKGSGVLIYIEKDQRTDLASVPRVAWSFLPPDGPWLKAAVLHDALYRLRGEVARLGHPAPYTRKESDDILREAMGVVGVDAADIAVIWRAVRFGGAGSWGS